MAVSVQPQVHLTRMSRYVVVFVPHLAHKELDAWTTFGADDTCESLKCQKPKTLDPNDYVHLGGIISLYDLSTEQTCMDCFSICGIRLDSKEKPIKNSRRMNDS